MLYAKPELKKSPSLAVMTLLLFILFVVAGGSKLAGVSYHMENFARWDYPLWFMYFTGVVELIGACVLLTPRLAVYASMLLSSAMLGAVMTHLSHGEASHAIISLFLLSLLAFIGYQYRQPLVDIVNALEDDNEGMHHT